MCVFAYMLSNIVIRCTMLPYNAAALVNTLLCYSQLVSVTLLCTAPCCSHMCDGCCATHLSTSLLPRSCNPVIAMAVTFAVSLFIDHASGRVVWVVCGVVWCGVVCGVVGCGGGGWGGVGWGVCWGGVRWEVHVAGAGYCGCHSHVVCCAMRQTRWSHLCI